mmetsp:Transcript_40088/g.82099  ORF Transcript_40088/g.82099 Transcript_40088/m.82099 type:complete len:117 (-) Transcript_40088:59-409(-)
MIGGLGSYWDVEEDLLRVMLLRALSRAKQQALSRARTLGCQQDRGGGMLDHLVRTRHCGGENHGVVSVPVKNRRHNRRIGGWKCSGRRGWRGWGRSHVVFGVLACVLVCAYVCSDV